MGVSGLISGESVHSDAGLLFKGSDVAQFADLVTSRLDCLEVSTGTVAFNPDSNLTEVKK